MAIPPPSYCEATNQHASLGGSLTFMDFIPEIVEEGFISSKYEPFGNLVERANVWLQKNPNYEVKTCESVEFKSSQGIPSSEKMTYKEYGERRTSYMRGLRLWLVIRNERRPPQKIGYYNLVPNIIEASLFGSDEYEKLDQLLERFNRSVSRIIHGRIISIESQEMKMSSMGFDPDRSKWTEHGEHATKFLFVIRIFFEYGEPTGEQIGIADFIPEALAEGGFLSYPEYEPFSNVIKKASQWCAAQHCIRYCNAQSLELKMKHGYSIDSQRMSYTEHGNRKTYYVRILRVAYAKCLETAAVPPPLHLTCKTIIPNQISFGMFSPEYERLPEVKLRLKRWIELTGARILSAETAAMRLRTGGEAVHGTEASFTYNRPDINEFWIFVFRLYLDGYYRDPPPELLPTPNVTADGDDCCIII